MQSDLGTHLPGTRNVFQQLHHGVRHVFQRSQVHSLVISELSRKRQLQSSQDMRQTHLPVTHIPMVLDNLPQMLRRQLCLSTINPASPSILSLFRKPPRLSLPPFPRLLFNFRLCQARMFRRRDSLSIKRTAHHRRVSGVESSSASSVAESRRWAESGWKGRHGFWLSGRVWWCRRTSARGDRGN